MLFHAVFSWISLLIFCHNISYKKIHSLCFSDILSFVLRPNIIRKWVDKSVWIIPLLNSVSRTVFVMQWSMVVAGCIYCGSSESTYCWNHTVRKLLIQTFSYLFICFKFQILNIEVSYKYYLFIFFSFLERTH